MSPGTSGDSVAVCRRRSHPWRPDEGAPLDLRGQRQRHADRLGGDEFHDTLVGSYTSANNAENMKTINLRGVRFDFPPMVTLKRLAFSKSPEV